MATYKWIEPNIYLVRSKAGKFLRYLCRTKHNDKDLTHNAMNLHDARVQIRKWKLQKETQRKAPPKPIETHKLAGWGFR